VSQAKVNFKNETAIVEAQESVRLKNMQEAVEKTGYRLR
jgi:copper chaperone CopZ